MPQHEAKGAKTVKADFSRSKNIMFCMTIQRQFVFALLLAVSLPAGPAGADLHVTPDARTGQSGASWDSAMTIEEAVAAANASPGATIRLLKGTYRPVGPLAIKENMRIYGGFLRQAAERPHGFPRTATSTIDGLGTTRLLEVAAGGVLLDGLELIRGAAIGRPGDGADPANAGGAIVVEKGARLTLNCCILSGNKALLGGAVENRGLLFAANSVFQGSLPWS